ncbi:MAG TPA: hypothetical protein VEB66_01340 [Opitutaceae bacterium]|nr:hypothetical protein [Opitutaceae bacterium]
MKPSDLRPALVALCLAAVPAGIAQVPPPPIESGAPDEPTPGPGQARREIQPPSGPLVPSPFPAPDPAAPPRAGEVSSPSAANPGLPQLGVGSLNIDALAAGGVDSALDPRATIANFNSAPRADQDVALADVRTRVDATRRALIELRARSRAEGAEVDSTRQGRLEAELEEQEEALKRTLATAPVAQTDDEWRRLQTEVSLQYEAYANAVRRVQLNLQSKEAEIPAER